MGHHPEDHAATGWGGERKSLFDYGGQAGAIDHHIGRAAEESLDGLAEIRGGGVDDVRGTVRAGLVKFMVMDVDGDDGIGAGEMSAEHGAETNTAAADDDEGFADAHLGIMSDDAETRGKRVGEQGAKFEIKIGWNRGEAVFGDDGELLKGGDVAGVDFGSVGAEVGTAAGLDAAARTPVNDDAIADLDVANFRADLANNAARLMSEQMGQIFIRTLRAGDFAELGTADAGGGDLDQHLAMAQCGDFELRDFQRAALFN